MNYFYIFLALLGGAILPYQATVNASLAQISGNPIFAAIISFIVGTLALLVFGLSSSIPWPSILKITSAPWWLWTGGFCGAFIVFSAIIAAPKIGTAALFAFIICGQMVSSLIFDHFGWFGFPIHPINWMRIIGATFLIFGAILIRNS
jgi:bacterial/archaeal transporter family-2 protein